MDLLKEKLKDGKVLFGTHICNADIFNVDLIGQMGFDYLWVDEEHTEIDKGDVQKILLANRAAGGGAKVFVRVPKLDPDALLTDPQSASPVQKIQAEAFESLAAELG